MSTYNVALVIVELVEADSEEEAIAKLRAKVREAGLNEYEGQPPDAFESEDL